MGIALRGSALRVQRQVDAPAPVVWNLLVDLTAWPSWGPSVRRAVLHDGATTVSLGAQGTVWTAAGVPLSFTITDYVPGRRWGWTVAGVPATGHEVRPTDEGCLASFDVPWWAAAYLPVCAVALARIDSLAHHPR